MENRDREIILKLVDSNAQLRRLYEEHMRIEESLSRFKSEPFLTPDEEVEERRLKKQKLLGVDRMMAMLNSCEPEHYQGEMAIM